MSLDYLETDLERAEYFQNMLVAYSTSGTADDNEYKQLRLYFLDDHNTKLLIPKFIRTNRDLPQFWQFIKHKFPTYAERRKFLWAEFSPLVEYFERGGEPPSTKDMSDLLDKFDAENVHVAWTKAYERQNNDPGGAVTAARTLLETVCKHLLDEQGIDYESNPKLTKLYSLVAKSLNLSPSQHSEESFRKILGGCSAVVDGLGSLRNALGDAHGQGKKGVKPLPRHAGLSVNLAGAMAMFLVETWEARKQAS